jgi:hypothetical protein
MKWPLVGRHRVEYLERELKYKLVALEAKDRELDTANEHLYAATELTQVLRELLAEAYVRNDALRKEFAGDLQLAHQRYDDFVRDMLERLLANPAKATTRASSPQEPALPTEIQAAIEEVSFGNSSLEAHLERQASALLAKNEKPVEIAEKIRKGDRPD